MNLQEAEILFYKPTCNWNFSLKIYLVNVNNLRSSVDLVTLLQKTFYLKSIVKPFSNMCWPETHSKHSKTPSMELFNIFHTKFHLWLGFEYTSADCQQRETKGYQLKSYKCRDIWFYWTKDLILRIYKSFYFTTTNISCICPDIVTCAKIATFICRWVLRKEPKKTEKDRETLYLF